MTSLARLLDMPETFDRLPASLRDQLEPLVAADLHIGPGASGAAHNVIDLALVRLFAARIVLKR